MWLQATLHVYNDQRMRFPTLGDTREFLTMMGQGKYGLPIHCCLFMRLHYEF